MTMRMNYLIHSGDVYYPSAEEFETLADAAKAFRKLREYRMGQVSMNAEIGNEPTDLGFDKDYLCVIIEELDPIQLAKDLGVIPPK
jgi:hypothetical protein